ncbi:MAG: hypothetical protein AAGG07_02455 [Planctomycetota bacterium]
MDLRIGFLSTIVMPLRPVLLSPLRAGEAFDVASGFAAPVFAVSVVFVFDFLASVFFEGALLASVFLEPAPGFAEEAGFAVVFLVVFFDPASLEATFLVVFLADDFLVVDAAVFLAVFFDPEAVEAAFLVVFLADDFLAAVFFDAVVFLEVFFFAKRDLAKGSRAGGRDDATSVRKRVSSLRWTPRQVKAAWPSTHQ